MSLRIDLSPENKEFLKQVIDFQFVMRYSVGRPQYDRHEVGCCFRCKMIKVQGAKIDRTAGVQL